MGTRKYSKRKNYYKLCVKFCEDKKLWIAITADGGIDYFTDVDVTGEDVCPDGYVKFGGKLAYEWLKREYKNLLEKE